MKYIFMQAAFMLFCLPLTAQTNDRVLYGQITKDSLTQAPFSNWFEKNYNAYHPDSATMKQFPAQAAFAGYSIEIFFGSWCGDSKRELPRMLKTLDACKFPHSAVTMIAVGSSDSLYKQSPGGEEKGRGIFRVPTLILYYKGTETARFTEYPVRSVEKDLLQMFTGKATVTQYPSYKLIRNWLQDGSLLDSNIASRSLAAQLKHIVSGENELNSAGYVLLQQHYLKEDLPFSGSTQIFIPNQPIS